MSQENVEVVERVHLAFLLDVARAYRDDREWQACVEKVESFFHPDWETVRRSALGSEEAHIGFEGSRRLWLAWLEPWESYRAVFERAIDCGERIVSLSHDYGRPWNSSREIVLPAPAGLWTFRHGKIARFDIYESRTDALEAVGLEE